MRKAVVGIFIVSFVGSCNLDSKQIKPDMVGRSGDVSVFMPKSMHETSLGTTVQDSLAKFISWLPQYEQQFDLVFYDSDNITRGAEQSRNILAFKIDPEGEPGLELVEDPPFAEGQLYLVVRGKDEAELVSVFQNECTRIRNVLNKWESVRIQHATNKNPHEAIAEELKGLMGVTLIVPKGSSVLEEKQREFAWIKRDHRRANHGNTYWVQEGVFIYHYPYTDTAQFKASELLKNRDAFLKKYVPGPERQVPTFMRTTPDSLFRPISKVIQHNGSYAVLVHGQWGITDESGAFYGIGGPFISLSVYDEKYGRIVTAEGYVHAPEFSVREYIRELESYIFSLEIGL